MREQMIPADESAKELTVKFLRKLSDWLGVSLNEVIEGMDQQPCEMGFSFGGVPFTLRCTHEKYRTTKEIRRFIFRIGVGHREYINSNDHASTRYFDFKVFDDKSLVRVESRITDMVEYATHQHSIYLQKEIKKQQDEEAITRDIKILSDAGVCFDHSKMVDASVGGFRGISVALKKGSPEVRCGFSFNGANEDAIRKLNLIAAILAD